MIAIDEYDLISSLHALYKINQRTNACMLMAPLCLHQTGLSRSKLLEVARSICDCLAVDVHDLLGADSPYTLVPGGEFMMGSPQSEFGRSPTEPFPSKEEIPYFMAVKRTLVTQREWLDVKPGKNPSSWLDSIFSSDDPRTRISGSCSFDPFDRPVDSVSWLDCIDWCKLLSNLRGINELKNGRYRLPSEREWEYFCRAGTNTATYLGNLQDERTDPVVDQIAWYFNNSHLEMIIPSETPHPVGLKRPNQWGLFDTLGSLWEWCSTKATFQKQSWREKKIHNLYYKNQTPRIVRGGAFDMGARFCRAASFSISFEGKASFDCGFRVVRTIGNTCRCSPTV